MKRRGFILGWQNKRWSSVVSGYDAGGNNPDITPGGNGPLPAFFTQTIRGRGYDIVNDSRELLSVNYFSSAIQYIDGSIYRFYVSCSKTSRTSGIYKSFGVIKCDSSGSFAEAAGGGWTELQSELGSNDLKYTAYEYFSETAQNSEWDKIVKNSPYIKEESYTMITGAEANRLYGILIDTKFIGEGTDTWLLKIKFAGQFWKEFPFTWEDSPTGTINDIVERALSFKTYKYWYGGAGQIGTMALLNSLANSYKSIYTPEYKAEAALDIGQRVSDCSYLVNFSYGIASPGNHGPGTREYNSRFSKWNGAPKNGMIVWKSDHTGIYYNGKTIEMVGLKYDYMERPYSKDKWLAILYDPNRSYD